MTAKEGVTVQVQAYAGSYHSTSILDAFLRAWAPVAGTFTLVEIGK